MSLQTEKVPRTDVTAIARGGGGIPHQRQIHIPPLDGLRGFAAMMVVLGHFAYFGTVSPVDAQLGNYGVLLFFALSGFLMAYLYLAKPISERGIATYLVARVSRIVPLYYATVIGGFLVGRFLDPNFKFAMSPGILLRHLLFVGSIPPFWSIGPEVQFYFLFPLLWWVACQPVDRALRYAIPLTALGLAVFFLRARWPGIILFSKMHIFLGGILLAVLRPRLRMHLDRRSILTLQFAAIAFLAVLFLPAAVTGDVVFPVQPGDVKLNRYYADVGRLLPLLFVVFAFTFESPLANALFANRLARLTGRFSFSLYLLRVPVMYLMQHLGFFEAVPYWPAILLVIALLYAVSTVSFYLLEEPSRILVRRHLLRLFDRAWAPRTERQAAPMQ